MPTGSRIVLRVAAEADIPTPDTDQVAFFADSDDSDAPAWKDDGGTVHALTGGTGPTGPGYGGTSTTSLAIGTGSKAFTTQAGLAYVAGSRVRAASDADPDTDWMEGVVASYVTTTLTVTVDLVGGSGTHTDWNLSLAGEQGPAGAGVPPTVVAHGAMGATETFDYGDGPAHSAEADAACTWTFTGATAGEVIMTVYLDVDASGPWAITLPASVANKTEAEAFLAAIPASTSAIIPFVTIDSGTTWTAMLDEGALTYGVDADITDQDFSDVADAGVLDKVARADHLHGMPANPGGGGVGGGCKAYNSTTQSISANSALTFDNEEYDTDGYHESVTNPTRLTIPATGDYEFAGGAFFDAATGSGPLFFKKNGTTAIRGSGFSLQAGYWNTQGAAHLSAGDYIELIYGASNTVNAGNATFLDAQSWISIHRVN